MDAAAEALLAAKMPLIYAGQGVHYAQAWTELRQVAELLEAPVCTSMEGKSAFPETHPLALGAGGNTSSRALATHVRESDVVFGVGVSFSPGYSIRWPTEGKRFIHNTVEERTSTRSCRRRIRSSATRSSRWRCCTRRSASGCAAGPAGSRRGRGAHPGAERSLDGRLDGAAHEQREAACRPTGSSTTCCRRSTCANTIVTHDAGSPRDEMIPFWKSVTPLSYLGWGKTTQLGYGFGLTMGAKVAHPEKLCINFWGEAAIGMTGMDFETCVRCQIPVMSILSNNFGMKTEYAAMKLSHEKYRTCDISGNYADFAKAMGGYGERVTEPEQVVHAIVNGIRATREGKPVLLEFITTQEVRYSSGGAVPVESDPAGAE